VLDALAQVAGFGAEEKVEDELDGIDLADGQYYLQTLQKIWRLTMAYIQ